MKKIHISTMGCPKNLVDSQVLAGHLRENRFEITRDPQEADTIIVNTCGFIEDAKKESIQAILEAVGLKQFGSGKQILVAGCLTQRYKDAIREEIPEIDAVFGTEDFSSILSYLGGTAVNAEQMYRARLLDADHHYAYLKISEGCNHTCSFCAIPAIRGKHRSRTMESLIEEAVVLAEKGVRELILVSQDTSFYGKDLYGEQKIVELLETLAGLKRFTWIRPLYWYPTNFPFEYIERMNAGGSLIPYLDMPVQHASDRVLRFMRRGETNKGLRALYGKIRKIQPEIALRTTIIVGHPGETESDFTILKDFLQEIRFERVGTFVYSDEEHTAAFDLDEKVDRETALKRQAEIMEIQQQISLEKNEALIGTKQKVIIDSYDSENKMYVARSYRDAPEIDNEVLISTDSEKRELIGTFQEVKIVDASEFELYAEPGVDK